MNPLLEKLDMESISTYFDNAYLLAVSEKEQPEWLTVAYIRRLCKETGIACRHLDDILCTLEEVLRKPELILFAKTVYHMLKIDKSCDNVFAGFELPCAPEGCTECSAYDLIAVFPILGCVRDGYDSLLKRGINEEIVKKTYEGVDSSIEASTVRVGRLSLNKLYFRWLTNYVRGSMLQIGRFVFEIIPNADLKLKAFLSADKEIKILMHGVKLHKSGAFLGSVGCTEEEGAYEAKVSEHSEYYEGYCVNPKSGLAENTITRLSKSMWRPFLLPGDTVVSVHIPGFEAFGQEYCEASYEMARKILKKSFPEYELKAFVCSSWLLARELPLLLKPESNILAFQKKYVLFPINSWGYGVFINVFKKAVSNIRDVDIEHLPEDTSLMRNVKTLYQKGGVVHESGGLFLL